MNFFKNIWNKIRSHYDKLFALLMFVVLAVSLIYLAVQLGLVNTKEQQFKREMAALVPKHEKAVVVNVDRFEFARRMVFEPFQIASQTWTNNPLFVVDKRFWCKDCKMPVPFESKACPFCGAQIPPDPSEDPDGDLDGDGIPYAIEIRWGLNPNDPSDAHADFDGDGFTNYEEVMAQPPTDPWDPDDFPPIEQKLRLDAIAVSPFRLKFRSKITMPNGSLQFGLNLGRGSQQTKTYFKQIDEEVEGFSLVKYEEKIQPDPVVISRDVSELTLKRGDKEIVLTMDQDIQHNEYLVRLLFPVDDTKLILSPGEMFKLREKTFQLISVDIVSQSVVIKRLSDGVNLVVQKVHGVSES